MRLIALLLIALMAGSAAHAAILIQPGKEYTFSGYLVIGRGPAPGAGPAVDAMRVRLSAHANGEIPAGFAGRQDLLLTQGGTENLFTLARRFGPATKVLVNGVGNAERGLTVAIVEEDRPVHAFGMATAPKFQGTQGLAKAKADALKRYARIHPPVGHPMADGYAAEVKDAYTVEISGHIVVVVDHFGGFGGMWRGKAIQFVYSPTGQFLSSRAI